MWDNINHNLGMYFIILFVNRKKKHFCFVVIDGLFIFLLDTTISIYGDSSSLMNSTLDYSYLFVNRQFRRISPWFPVRTLIFPILLMDRANDLRKSSKPGANS
jgi:hypothetical protein